MKVTVRYRQCLVDIALQVCGSTEAVFALAEQNGLSITDDLEVGQELTYELTDVVSRQVVAQYAEEGVVPTAAADDKLLRSLLVVDDAEDNTADLDSTTDAVEPVPLTCIFTEHFDTQFA